MATKRVADMTVEELKAIIASVVAQQLSLMKTNLAQDISDLINCNRGNATFLSQSQSSPDAHGLSREAEAKPIEVNQDLRQWLDEWVEEVNKEV